MQRLLALGSGRVELADLPRAIRTSSARIAETEHSAASETESPRAELERALAEAAGNITHAARALGLTRHGFKKRMLRLGVRATGGSRG
jgi:transcriptional regulator of acetoin/glycerol metabolism